MRIMGVDTGGTFTDFVYVDGEQLLTHKELSTPSNPEQAILRGIDALQIPVQELTIVHGTTVATNALLERKGARTVFITNHGFKDILLIGRQTRSELYNLTPKKKRSLFDPQLNLEVGGRLSPQGETIQPLSNAEIDAVLATLASLNPEAIAICLLFSFIDDRYERMLLDRLAKKYFVSISSVVLAEHREYERAVATWLNSYLGPVMHDYLSCLRTRLPQTLIAVMQSHGLTLDAADAESYAVRLMLSGPAGGLWGSLYVGEKIGHQQLLTFDMGGTSTDVAIIDRELQLTKRSKLAGLPIAVPMLDIHTIGAGGGSIAWVDEGGLLQVGPQSAGAQPGPACYAQGGKEATVTDAHVVLGRLPASSKLAGSVSLDHAAAQQALSVIAKKLKINVLACAQGIIRIANEHMVQALRVMSVHRGHDPKNFTLVSFGGAGGLHVCDLAEALHMTYALVPHHAGLLSAFGLLIAPPGRELSHSYIKLLAECDDAEIEKQFAHLTKRIYQQLDTQAQHDFTIKYEIEARYHGQSACLKLNWQSVTESISAFHALHKQRYGYALDMPVELVNLQLTASGTKNDLDLPISKNEKAAKPTTWVELHELQQQVPVFWRETLGRKQMLKGPAIILEKDTTVYLAPNWLASMQDSGSLLLERMVQGSSNI